MADPNPYVYGGGAFAALAGILARYSREIGREAPHLIHLATHFPGPAIGGIAGYVVADQIGFDGGGAVFVALIGLVIGLGVQKQIEGGAEASLPRSAEGERKQDE